MPNVKEKSLVDIGPFKGISNWLAGYYIEPKQATDLVNLIPASHIGSYFTTLGRSTLVTTPLSNPILGLTRFDFAGSTSQYIAASDAVLNTTAGLWRTLAAGTWTALTIPASLTLTAAKATYFAQFNDRLYGVDGTDVPFKIDSSFNVTPLQPVPPVATPTLASGAAGNPNGTYFYRFTYANSFQETGAGPISAAITVTNQQITVTGIPASAPDPQLTAVNIYRLGGTFAIWKFVGSTTFGAASFTDNVADGNLGAQMTITRDAPPTGAFTITVHKDRLFMFGTSVDQAGLYYSNYKEPWGWDQTNQYSTIGSSVVSDYAQQLATTGSILMMFKKQTTWALYGDDPTSFIFRKLFDIGCIAPRSVAVGLGVVFWLAKDGVWMFDGNQPSRVSNNISGTILGLTLSQLGRACGFFRDGIYYISFPTQGVTYAYDLLSKEMYKLGWAAEVAFQDPSTSEIEGSESGTGVVDTWFTGPTDKGAQITASFIGKIDDSGEPQFRKFYRWGLVVAPVQASQTATLTITYNPGTAQFTTSKVVSLSGPNPRQLVSLPVPTTAYQAQVQITTTSSVQIEIQKLQLWGWTQQEFIP